jgi:phosphoesterase RecJ-like protein
MNNRLEAVAGQLWGESEGKTFHIFGHIQPDGDALGSQLALWHALRVTGHEAIPVLIDPLPPTYQFLPGREAFVPWQTVGAVERAIVLDCTGWDRLGPAADLAQSATVVVNVDHHRSNNNFGHFNYVDQNAAAAGELVFRLLQAAQVPIQPATATCLYTAIATDTGSFRYQNTTPGALRVAAELLDLGADLATIIQNVYQTVSLPSLRLLGDALQTLQLFYGGRLAILTVSKQLRQESGATEQDVEGIVNYARSVQGCEVGALLHEKDDGTVKVSLRSREKVDVSQLAARFGGGGHLRVAGYAVLGGMARAQAELVAEVGKYLDGHP